MPDVRKILADPTFQQMDLEERRKVLLKVDGARFGAMAREEQDKVLNFQISQPKPAMSGEQRQLMSGLTGGADATIGARGPQVGGSLTALGEQIMPALSRADEAIRNFFGGVHPDPMLEAIAQGKREPIMRTPMLAASEFANAIPSGDQIRKPSVVIDPLAEEALAMSEGIKPVATGVMKTAESFTTPENAIILAISGAAGKIPAVGQALSAATGAGFDAMMISQAIQSAPELKQRFESGDIEGAIEAGTELLAAGAMGAHGGKGKVDALRKQPGMTARPLEQQNARLALEDAVKLTPEQLEQRNRELQQQGSPAVADVQQVAHEDKLQEGAYSDKGRKAVRRKADDLRQEMPRSAGMLDELARQKQQPAGREGKPSNTENIGEGEMRRAVREDVAVPEEGPSLEEQQMVDRMERLAEGYGKKFEDLTPDEQDEVFDLAKQGFSNPETTRTRATERTERKDLAAEMDRLAGELGVKFEDLGPDDQRAVHQLAVEARRKASETKAPVEETEEPVRETVQPKADTDQPVTETVDQLEEPDGKVVQPRQPKTAPVYGRQTEVLIPGEKKKYLGAYALREAEDVISSHNAQSFEPRAEYEFTNDRDYSQPQNAERVVKQTAEFDPAYLVNDNPTAENGPPIIDSRGNVLGGNSRAMTIERARRNPQAADAYRKELRNQAKKLGLDPAAVDKLKEPVLVRELVDVPDAQAAITDLNKKGTAELRLAERAVSDSRRVSAKTLEEIAGRIEEQGAEGTLAKALEGDARGIVDRLTEDGVLTVQERPRLMNGDGRLTAEGKQRIGQLMVGRLFESARHFEDAAPELKAKLERVVPTVARLEGKGEWDIGGDVRSAVQLAEEARTRDLTIDELTAQRGMFGDRNYSREAIALGKLLREGKPTEIVKRFRQYANEASMAEGGQGMLGMEAPTRGEAFEAAFGPERNGTAAAKGKPLDKAAQAKIEKQVYESGALSLVRPEEVRINYAKGKPTAAEIETGARVKYFAPKGDRPAVVSLNDQAMQVAGGILGYPRANGLTVPMRDSRYLRLELGKKIAKAKGEQRAALEKLSEAIAKAAEANTNGNLVLLNGERGINRKELMMTLREELTHYEQFRWSEAPELQTLGARAMQRPEWKRIQSYLDGTGYAEGRPAQKVMEAGAQVAAGRWKEMGLTIDEAQAWFTAYLDEAYAWNGEATGRVARWARKEIRDAYNKWEETRQRYTDAGGKNNESLGGGDRGEGGGGGSANATGRNTREGSARSTDGRVPDGEERVRAGKRGAAGEEAGGVAGAGRDADRQAERGRLQPLRGDAEGSPGKERGRTAADAEQRGAGERFALEKLPEGAEYQRKLMRSRLDRTPIADATNVVSVNRVADAAYVERKGKRPGAVYVNQAGRMLMDRAMEEAFGEKAEAVGLTLTKGDVRKVADALQGESYVMALAGDWTAVGRVRKVMTALERASTAEDTINVVSNEAPSLGETKRTRRHESIHEALGRLDPTGERLLDWFESYDDLLSRDSVKAAAERLKRIGYQDFEVGDELAVHVGAGQWERLGLNLDEAADYFHAYYDKLSAQYGAEATAHILERVDARVRDKYAENKKGGDDANKKSMAPGADERAGQGGEGGREADARGAGGEVRQESAGADGSGRARERRAEDEAGGDRGAGEGGRTRRGVAEYLKQRGATAEAPAETAKLKQTQEGGGGRGGKTIERPAPTESPDPKGGGEQPSTPGKAEGGNEKRIVTSPSYDQTRENFIERVGLDDKTKELVREGLGEWEKKNPERQTVTFADIAEEAKAYDPRLILELDRKKAQDLLVTDGAMRFAARNAQHAIAREIGSLSDRLGRESVVGGERQRLERKREQLESDFQKLTDLLIPTRSQIGRMLAYENMMAENSFDVTYWLQRARRAQALPEGVALPDKDVERVREATERGQAAEDAAVERVQQQPKTPKEIERQAEEELAAEGIVKPEEVKATPETGKTGKKGPGRPETGKPAAKSRVERAKQAAMKEAAEKEAITREQIVAKTRKALLDRLDRALIDLKTPKVEPVSPAERALWEQDPEVIVRRAKLANYRQELREKRDGPLTREKEVERKRQEFISRLEARAKGKSVEVNPVKPEERALWENDPKVLELRAEIARKFPPKPEPTLAERQEHYRKQLLERIEQLTTGEKRERKASKWELTPDQRKQVENDPQVRAAARELARILKEQRKDGWLTYVSSLRSAGLLSAPATHIRNISSNAAFQVFNEASRPMAMLADWAIRNLAKGKAVEERTVAGVRWKDIQAASREGAVKGWQEAKEIMNTGEVRNGDTALFDFTRELNAKHLFENRAGLKHLAWTNDAINLVFRSLKAEDRFFKRYAYERSLREQMELAKVKVPTEEMMVQAWADADFMTFNNENVAAKGLNQGLAWAEKRGLSGKLGSFVVKLFLPFRNTPANVWMRGFESMGGGLLTGPVKLIAQEGKLTAVQQRGIAMEMGRGATGLGLLALGFLGARNGFISGMTPEDERGKRGVQQAAGKPDGSIRIGDKWVSITGLSPLANVILVGATLARRYDDPLAFLSNADEALALFNSTVKDQPMLRGLNDMIDAIQNKNNRMGTMLSGMAGSFVPSIANAVGQATDSKRRDARGNNMIERAGKAVMSRTPGLRQMLPEKLDVMGKPMEQSRIGATLGFPVETESQNPVLREMVRVGVGMGEGKPREGEKKVDYETRLAAARKAGLGIPERMPKESHEDFAARQAAIGDSILKRLERLMQTEEYRGMDLVEQQHAMEEQISRARKRAAMVAKLRGYADVPAAQKREWIGERMGR